VDAPPGLDFADAPLLSSVCDGTLMVVQAGAIRRPAARRTMERLLASNANILGVLLTKFDIKRTGYSYGYSYGYGYRGYRSDAADTASREALAKRRVRLFSPETQGANADPRP
jgi:Mrp family chromosome partitioning ATPase